MCLHWGKGTWSWPFPQKVNHRKPLGFQLALDSTSSYKVSYWELTILSGWGTEGGGGLWMKTDIKILHVRSKQFEAGVAKMLRKTRGCINSLTRPEHCRMLFTYF